MMGGKRKTLQLLQQQACSVSGALWPVEICRCVPTGKAAQSRRLLIMNGFLHGFSLANVRVKRSRRCSRCNNMVEYISYVKVIQRTYPARHSLYRQTFFLSFVAGLLAAGMSLTILIVHHWSLVLLLALVWLVTAFVTFRLLANDMRLLRSFFSAFSRFFSTLRLWSHLQVQFVTSSLPPTPATEPAPAKFQRSFMPARFPETPMPSTPLIRVLETIDLSSTSIEHFLEEEKQTSAEMPVIYEHYRQADFLE